MDEKEFEEKLKRALEPDDCEDQEDTETNAKDMAAFLTNILKMGSMVELSKAANARITTLVDNLVKDLSKLDKSDVAIHHAKAVYRIKKAAAELDILHTIVIASSITGVALIGGADDSYDEILNTIIRAITK